RRSPARRALTGSGTGPGRRPALHPSGNSPLARFRGPCKAGRRTMQEQRADIAVVGGGIVGLAVALATARQGRQVVLFERSDPAVGASVRNFGLVWPIGQPTGPTHDLALRSREI